MAHVWDPARYLRYADERGRPFRELLARVGAERPARVVDLGCGPGTLTALLAERWPDAEVAGVDASPDMVAIAREAQPAIRFTLRDLRAWSASPPVDVLVSNAALQWVPGHLDLLARLVDQVAAGGWLALQVPGNHDEPSHALRRELAEDPRFAPHLRDVASPAAHDADVYLARLAPLGRAVDVWETTYLHLLPGEDPVLDWVSGTSARPTLQALPPDRRAEFEAELGAALRAAYPRTEHGTLLPFRRVFAVLRT